ncbi:acyl-CoA synthetase [Gordonia terrae]|uniref:Acyl-CoA synthetase n=2 Tax=Gordonia terrae TaxID=2055 RepID=A0AAD0KBR7_9ACTN|nr:acyl-CoA synthetase [Gordonia terrae]VTR09545.1 AMP-dependent synthetase and ligase [Clostridioides difficile]ANY25819.1 acyl-CoA synthetase [Gordonia terrae]AWO86551.1 acyl-CoA synthetase [Gordonia terrae]VTS28841.1 Long-chain-fatty-acid--CoA ligase [Gordonia terrae]GAB46377.1 putative fatty-acid--CoA ligase [Gordonia terrae NBRC 100016]
MYPGTHAANRPDKPALVMASTGQVVTYAQLEHNSRQIAHLFGELGLRRGDHIAVVSTNEARIFEIYWAALRTGLYITAVNSHLTAAEVAYIVGDCEAKAVFFSASMAKIAVDAELHAATPRVLLRLSFGGDIQGHRRLETLMQTMPTTEPVDQPRGADMLYSSGTTGKPKGIEPTLPDRQVGDPGDTMTALARDRWSFDADTVYLSPAPLYHAAPLRTCAAVQALGGTVVVMDRFDAERALELIEAYRITHSQWVPTMFVRMLKLDKHIRTKYDVSSLRVAIHAAAPCPVEVKHAMIDWWGPILLEYYSSTELNGMTLISSQEWLRKPGSVGRDNVLGTAHICDDDGRELPPNEVGVLYFERDSLPFRYHNDPDKTAKAQHPQHPTWTTTGDVGYLDEDRYLFLTDRKSFMIISGGVNIYPQEIENCLTMHPQVLDIAVIGEPDPDLGESVLAVVQRDTDDHDHDNVIEQSLRTLAADRLARYKQPRRYLFVDQLPRTPTGKLAKHRIVTP